MIIESGDIYEAFALWSVLVLFVKARSNALYPKPRILFMILAITNNDTHKHNNRHNTSNSNHNNNSNSQ